MSDGEAYGKLQTILWLTFREKYNTIRTEKNEHKFARRKEMAKEDKYKEINAVKNSDRIIKS